MSLMSTLSSAVELAGTMAAAGIIAVIGVAGAIYLDIVTFLLSAGILCFVNTREQDMVRRKFDGKTYFTDLREGFTYVRKSSEVCYLLLVVLFSEWNSCPVKQLAGSDDRGDSARRCPDAVCSWRGTDGRNAAWLCDLSGSEKICDR